MTSAKILTGRIIAWLRVHWRNLAIITALLLVTGWVTASNIAHYPMRFEDEGTYISQAWAIQHWQQLAHYTYWYDHPPLAWAQLAVWTTLTQAFERYDSAIVAGREFMVVVRLASCVLLYALALKLGIRKLFAALAVLLFALSPLSVEFGRMVLLDNIALLWVLAAFVLATSAHKHVSAFAGAATCMAIAVLSKETMLILLPALLYMLWQQSDHRNRRYGTVIFGVLFSMLCGFYVLYAALKNELLEGAGHVSLLGTTKWQLFEREGSGSVFDPNSDARGLIELWTGADPWLVAIGILCIPLAIFYKQLRPIAAALLILVLLALRPGYLPFPYIIALLPFAALMIAGVFDRFLAVAPSRLKLPGNWPKHLTAATAIMSIVAFCYLVAPGWQTKLQAQHSLDADSSARQAISWVNMNVTRTERVVVDSVLWMDLVDKGFTDPSPVWIYKTENDPAVVHEIGGWRGIDYVVVAHAALGVDQRDKFPTVFAAKDHARTVASFGENEQKIVILEVANGKNRQLAHTYQQPSITTKSQPKETVIVPTKLPSVGNESIVTLFIGASATAGLGHRYYQHRKQSKSSRQNT